MKEREGKRKDATRGRTQRRKRKGNGIKANANTGRKDDDEKRVGGGGKKREEEQWEATGQLNVRDSRRGRGKVREIPERFKRIKESYRYCRYCISQIEDCQEVPTKSTHWSHSKKGENFATFPEQFDVILC